jgi:phosphatidylglycerol:prolipoprotein diacylglycerol transferase
MTPQTLLDAGLAALAAGLIGARVAFVSAHWGYYSSRLMEALVFRQGGLNWAGGALGALLGLAGFALLARRPFWPLADSLAFPGALVALASWTGCLLDGSAYGRPVANPLAPASPDLFGTRLPRWPTQALGALYGLAVLLGVLWLHDRRLRPGLLGTLMLTLTAAGALALDFTRGDPSPLLAGLRLDALGAAAILAAALVGLAQRLVAR